MNISEVAQLVNDNIFIKRTEDGLDGEYTIRDGAPEWIREIAAPDMLIYVDMAAEEIALCDEFSGDEDRDSQIARERAEEIDLWTRQTFISRMGNLLDWLTADITRVGYVDELMQEEGFNNLLDVLTGAHIHHIRVVALDTAEAIIDQVDWD